MKAFRIFLVNLPANSGEKKMELHDALLKAIEITKASASSGINPDSLPKLVRNLHKEILKLSKENE